MPYDMGIGPTVIVIAGATATQKEIKGQKGISLLENGPAVNEAMRDTRKMHIMISVMVVLYCANGTSDGVVTGNVVVVHVCGVVGKMGINAVELEKTFQNSVVIKESGPQGTKRQPGRVQPPFGSSAKVLR